MSLAGSHVTVIGATTTAVRLVDELVRSGETVKVLLPTHPTGGGGKQELIADVRAELARSRVEVRTVTQLRESELRACGLDTAKAVVILGEDDVTTVRIALVVEDINPQARLVLELANVSFGERLGPLLGNCQVLSSAGLAAPAFVAAALPGGEVTAFQFAGRAVAAGSRGRVGGDLLAVLGRVDAHRSRDLLKATGEVDDDDIVLGTRVIGEGVRPVRRRGWFGAFTGVFDRKLRAVVAGLVALVVLSTLYFRFVGHLGWWSALYVALTASTLTGLGDVEQMSLLTRFGGVIIQLFGLILSSGITAVIIDALLTSRLALLTGGVRGRPRHHVIVCGLGRLGLAVTRSLHQRGLGVVAIERREEAPGVAIARREGIAVIVADASDRFVLEQAHIHRADAVLAVTDNDAANLEVSLLAHSVDPDLRIVTRLYDHELADRFERRLHTGPTRSVSMLAAPAFAAAALERRHETIVPVGRRVIIFTELRIQPGSRAAAGVAIDDLASAGTVAVLAVRRQGEDDWTWRPSGVVRAEDRVAVAATRHGLAEVLRQVKAHPRRARS